MRSRKQGPVSPLVISSGTPLSEVDDHARRLEGSLAPVITLMNATGIAAAGFMVADAVEIELNRDCRPDAATEEKLRLARAAIREQAGRGGPGAELALPDALIVLGRHAVTLFGDPRVGDAWSSHVRLVAPSSLRPAVG